MKKINTQEEWIDRAKEVLPAAGFGNFENDIIIKRGKGSKVWDENNNEYVIIKRLSEAGTITIAEAD